MQYNNKLVFATNNAHKLDEVRAILGHKFEIISLSDLGCNDEIEETANTLKGNALIKAQYIYDKFGLNCFADDTGLEVEALNGEPGVRSARYAGLDCNPVENTKKLLKAMESEHDRTARFCTVIALFLEGEVLYFEGEIEGEIGLVPQGDKGFGYDPVFIPKGYSKSFAQLGNEAKNKISHRALAVQKLTDYLTQYSDFAD